MKKLSTIVLRIAIIGISLGILAVCTVLLPYLLSDIPEAYAPYVGAVYAVFGALYAAAIPFFIGMYKAWRLLDLIDRGKAFSFESVKNVRVIAWCAGIISGIYIISLPFFYIWADGDDAPGLVLIGMVLAGAPFIVAIFAGLLQRLIAEASDLQLESELTV